MREILFRGKYKDSRWEYGYITYDKRTQCFYIGMDDWRAPVHPNTIGQFTGLRDKNGQSIFEGDIIRFDNNDIDHVVDYFGNGFVLKVKDSVYVRNFTGKSLTVVGNIHDKEGGDNA